MKRKFALMLVVLLLSIQVSSCAHIVPGWNQMDELQKRQAIAAKYTLASGYFHSFCRGLIVTATALSFIDPPTAALAVSIAKTADLLVNGLDGIIAAFLLGEKTQEDVEVALKAVHTKIKEANDAVGSAEAKVKMKLKLQMIVPPEGVSQLWPMVSY